MSPGAENRRVGGITQEERLDEREEEGGSVHPQLEEMIASWYKA